ncbi:MAG TPA: Lrp/AsnC family transcriptional regulator [Anaerolineae bacterium]|nr:Lrp/AsnC family transcriptional regulator [Anaerolineae bacterium]
MKAYILIVVHTGEIHKVVHQLKRVEGVVETSMTFGPYDAIAVVEAEDIQGIGDILASKIQPIPGVRETLTCLAVEG